MENVTNRLEGFRIEKAVRALELRTKIRNRAARAVNRRNSVVSCFLGNKITNAQVKDYSDWLRGYMEKGGSPTYSYSYPMSRVIDNFFIARDNFEIVSLHGSGGLNIIVPEYVEFLGGDLGHSNLYFMNGHQQVGGFIPVYSDIVFD